MTIAALPACRVVPSSFAFQVSNSSAESTPELAPSVALLVEAKLIDWRNPWESRDGFRRWLSPSNVAEEDGGDKR